MSKEDLPRQYYNIVDALNSVRGANLSYIAKILGISRSTLFRRLNLLKSKYGLRKRIIIKNWCIGLRTVLAILKPVSYKAIDLVIDYIKEVIGLNRIYVTLSPRIKIIAKHIILNEEQYDKLIEKYDSLNELIEIEDVMKYNYVVRPILFYTNKRVEISKSLLGECSFREPDYIDYLIIDGLLRNIGSLTRIAEVYNISPSRLFYHYEEHVKRVIYGYHYVFYREPNIIIEAVVDSINDLACFINSMFKDNVIDYIDEVNIVELSYPLITLIEAHGDVNKVLERIHSHASACRIIDIKAYNVVRRYENLHMPIE